MVDRPSLEVQSEAYFDNDGKPHLPAGEIKNKPVLGERGESGENPHKSLKNTRAKKGEKAQNSPLETYKQPVYPVEALGVLANVCRYMRDEMQLPVETAGQSLLTAASLLTQDLYDVKTLTGVKPLSIYALTLSDSGDGKSTADEVALKRISEADFQSHKDYEVKMAEWLGLSKREKENTPQPKAPYRMMKSATVQGIVRSFKEGVSSQGSFTAEAASMLSGWGMSAEQKNNTRSELNSLWDGGSISQVTKGEGRIQLYGKRFCCHWLVQPSAARESLNDDSASTIGFWPRFLVAWPEPMKPRKYKPFNPAESEAVKSFWEYCDALLNERHSIPLDKKNVIKLSEAAQKLLIESFEKLEQSRDPGSKLNHLKVFCVRGAEQICRVAGVLAAFRNHPKGVTDFLVTDGDIKNAVALFTYNLDTWLGIFGKREDIEHHTWANDLHAWLLKQTERQASETAMLKRTPKHLRSSHKRDVAVSILQEQGRIERVIDVLPNGAMQVSRNVWRAAQCQK
ncbi:DUF3987 domain-containing protein [Nitrosomonas sp. Is37]|uniref:DUF3987 domain-containing protein n=1 Tax=Nitrosomonas sp. Is37 TaxID=3080535 RepID=UPI00294AB568|nr:DUF3987 domain-containing protein [Nitrosomonas sp. Is37]MDV6345406.1 DUF3987 domain-containing protein [Nitrosomonas sp. Is37]